MIMFAIKRVISSERRPLWLIDLLLGVDRTFYDYQVSKEDVKVSLILLEKKLKKHKVRWRRSLFSSSHFLHYSLVQDRLIVSNKKERGYIYMEFQIQERVNYG